MNRYSPFEHHHGGGSPDPEQKQGTRDAQNPLGRIQKQIIGVLREHEAGAKPADLCRKHGMSEATLYNWKSKFGGMDISDAKRLKALEERTAG